MGAPPTGNAIWSMKSVKAIVDTEYQPTGQLIENVQYEPEIVPYALIRPSA